jgi:uncharacterized protein (TIGR03085 family)
MTSHALDERRDLIDLLTEVGPDAPTLCTGWDTRLLLTHLILRERSLLTAAARLRLPTAVRALDNAMVSYAETHEYEQMLTTFASRAPLYSVFAVPALYESFNLLEYAVHLEDVRRATEAVVSARTIPMDRQRAIFSRLKGFAKLTMRSAPGPVELRWGTVDSIRVGKGNSPISITGDPIELTLFAFGRQPVAQVEYSGDADSIAKLRGLPLAV